MLAVPPGGAGLEYYAIDSKGAPQLHHIQHVAGRAILIECARPHKVRPLRDTDGLAPRIVMHAFVVPCSQDESMGSEMEYVLIGPIGGDV